MKTILKIYGWSLLILFSTACSEELDGLADMEKYPQLYMAQARETVEANLFMKDEIQIIQFGASYGGLDLPSGEIGVSFEVAPDLVDGFNQRNNTSYDLLPANAYTIENLSTTIQPGNSTSAPLSLQVHTHGKLEARKQYLLPVTLVSATSDVPIRESLKTTYFLMRADYQQHDRSNWEIADLSSEEVVGEGAPRGYARNMLDGNVNTYWHSKWTAPKETYPHWVVIDMKEQRQLLGTKITGRLGRANNVGNPRYIVIEISNDRITWEEIDNVELPQNEANELLFNRAYHGQYLRLTVNESWGYSYNTTYNHTHISEVEFF